MKLSEVSHLMQCGDYLFFRGTRWTSFLIRWLTGDYSHVALLLKPIYLKDLEFLEVAESLWGTGVKRRPLDRYLAECWQHGVSVEWYRLDETKVDREKLVRAALRHLDLPYANWWQLSLSFGLVGRWARKYFRIKLDVGRLSQVCSEYGAYALFAGLVNKNGTTRTDWQAMTPMQMAELDCWKEKVELTI